MANVLQSGAIWLAARLKEVAPWTVVYRRGAASVTVQATLGSQLLRLSDRSGNVRVERTDRDFLITTADLILSGSATLPEPGDTVDVTIGSTTERFEVMPFGNEPAWHYSDPFHTLLRIHTKFIGNVP